ncbi:Dolichyl-diphosphooligosaccharide--protein glycosyltransferase subunit WBP1 [Geopyxis carbonaria]|nr:Dolichyl-diphosphooligosaccharide--protein glycosyltransferase subunit WBP1 [Geopyxis carbonaria]
MILHSFLFCLLCVWAPFIQATSLTGPRLLVILEETTLKNDYSKFLGDLKARGYELDFQSPKSDSLSLFIHGERAYDHVLLFPPKSKGYGPALTPQLLTQFIEKEGNILLLTSPSGTPEQARELARELDIELPPRDYSAVDHFNYDSISSPEKHDIILVNRPAQSKGKQNYFSGKSDDEVIAFRGAGHILGNRPLLFPILSGSRTAYTYDTKEDFAYAEDAWTTGTQMHYVTGMQARNNARFTVSGSTEMFSDEYFGMEVSKRNGKKVITANRKFAKEITQWTFKETGVLKVVGIKHYLTNQTNAEINPSIYRVKNDVATFEIELAEWSVNHWMPFTVPVEDSMQLEFTMLDPYYRLPLLPTTTKAESRIYSTSFRVPDQHGVFAFKVNYKRPLVTYLEEKYTVTVRHFAHNEYTRSWDITGAWVWVSGIGVTITGWSVFCALWLYGAPTDKSIKKTQ